MGVNFRPNLTSLHPEVEIHRPLQRHAHKLGLKHQFCDPYPPRSQTSYSCFHSIRFDLQDNRTMLALLTQVSGRTNGSRTRSEYSSAERAREADSWVRPRCRFAAARASAGPRRAVPNTTGGSITNPPMDAVSCPSVPLEHSSGTTPRAQFEKKSRWKPSAKVSLCEPGVVLDVKKESWVTI